MPSQIRTSQTKPAVWYARMYVATYVYTYIFHKYVITRFTYNKNVKLLVKHIKFYSYSYVHTYVCHNINRLNHFFFKMFAMADLCNIRYRLNVMSQSCMCASAITHAQVQSPTIARECK